MSSGQDTLPTLPGLMILMNASEYFWVVVVGRVALHASFSRGRSESPLNTSNTWLQHAEHVKPVELIADSNEIISV